MVRVLKACRTTLLILAALAALPSAAFAQASIAGVVKDSSGAVLPGVTVEASSPALIEKTRSVLSDGSGQYKILNLRPGTYTVTFSLTGFASIKRDGIELTGSFVATVNADLRLGSLEETVTVSGESPIVDIQSTTHERVLGREAIEAIPTSNTHFSVATLIPAMQSSNTADVGGTNAISLVALTAHGGRNTDMRVLLDGLSTNNTLQFFRGVARLPIYGPVGVGAGYSWYSRKTTYPGFFEPRKTQGEWRAFVNAAFAFR